MKFRLTFILTFFAVFLLFAPQFSEAQPTPADTTNIIEGTGLEYIEYGGTITMYGDPTGTHYSNPFSINRVAGQAGTLRLQTSNPQDPNGVDIRVRFLVSYDILGTTTSTYTALPDSVDMSGSATAWTSIGGANGSKYNTAYWAVIEADGLTAANLDSTEVAWQFRGYRPVPSTHPGQVMN